MAFINYVVGCFNDSHALAFLFSHTFCHLSLSLLPSSNRYQYISLSIEKKIYQKFVEKIAFYIGLTIQDFKKSRLGREHWLTE